MILEKDFLIFDYYSFQSTFLFFEQSILTTDNYYMFGNQYNQTEYFLSTLKKDVIMNNFSNSILKQNSSNGDLNLEKSMYEIRIFYTNKYTLYKRTFLGLDDVLSHLGGIFQFVIIFFNYIVSMYSKIYLYANSLYDTKLSDINSFIKLLEKKHSAIDSNQISVIF